MSVSHDFTSQWARGNENITKKVTIVGDGGQDRSVAVPDSTTDLQVVFLLTLAQCKLLILSSDQNLTIKTNDGTTPQETLSLIADEPLIWHEKMLGLALTDIFAGNLTDLYVTNASGAAATLEVRTVEDDTP